MLTKSELRALARARRAGLHRQDFAASLAAHADALGIGRGMIVAGYHAHKDEADPSELLRALADEGAAIAFPRMVARGKALEFHLVPPGEKLEQAAFGIFEPLGHWPRATPDVLLVPLLAYDDLGQRLGYGGGYYDRTLVALPTARAIGIAYAGQHMDFLPHDEHDCRLDAVLHEKGLVAFPL